MLGERVAARWLARRGWEIVACRFRSGHRDLDLVARRGALVAFVEVKARRGLAFGDPVEAVRWRKQRELVRSANVWIDRFGRPGDAYRFDVIGVVLPPAGGARPTGGWCGSGTSRTPSRCRPVLDIRPESS